MPAPQQASGIMQQLSWTIGVSQEIPSHETYIPLGSVLDCVMLAHDNLHILEEVSEEGLLSLHLVCCLLAVLHGPVPW